MESQDVTLLDNMIERGSMMLHHTQSAIAREAYRRFSSPMQRLQPLPDIAGWELAHGRRTYL